MDFADQHAVPPSPMCDTRQCLVCTCTHDELDRTDAAYPYRHTEEVRAKVQAAHSEHLDDEDRSDRVKDRHQTKRYQGKIVYGVEYDVVYDVVYDFYSLYTYSISYTIS